MGAQSELDFHQPVGDPPAGSISNTELATMAEATVKGRARGAGTGTVTDLSGAQTGAIVRYTGLESFSMTAGTTNTLTVSESTTWVYVSITGTGDVIIDEIASTSAAARNGQRLIIAKNTGSGRVILRNNVAKANNQITAPANADWYLDSVTLSAVDIMHNGISWCIGNAYVTPAQLTGPVSGLSVPFTVYVSCPSGGAAGTADDVTIWNANAPYAMRILDATLRVSTAVGGSTAALRTASGGGGSVVLPDVGAATQTFSTATTGPHDDVAAATATVAAGGSLFLRRSDRSAVGELILTCIRT